MEADEALRFAPGCRYNGLAASAWRSVKQPNGLRPTSEFEPRELHDSSPPAPGEGAILSKTAVLKTIVCAIAANMGIASTASATGACCDGATCTEVAEVECVSGVWLGELTTCGSDCDGDGTVDACAIAQGTSNDCNADGLPDECMTFATQQSGAEPFVANTCISFSAATSGELMAVRVLFDDLPAPYDIWNGFTVWVGEPYEVSENGKSVDPIPGWSNFWGTTLQCDPVYLNWNDYGDVFIRGVREGVIYDADGVVPSARYVLQAIPAGCSIADPKNYSAPYTAVTSRWGDSVGAFNVGTQTWAGPDGSVDVASDVVAGIDKFGSLPTSPPKARADVEPSKLWIIGITDITVILDAFGGGGFPFAPDDATPCP